MTVITRRGPYRPLKVTLADALAVHHDARVRFLTAVDEDAPKEQVTPTCDYHCDLETLCESPTASGVVRTADFLGGLVSAAQGLMWPSSELSYTHGFTSSHSAIPQQR